MAEADRVQKAGGAATRFLCGARGSRLSVAQAKDSLACIGREVSGFAAELLLFETPGDRDLKTPIESGAPDFFTRDLDDAVRSGKIDFAIHSAKDLPNPVPEDLDWFWLPNREDARDCWVARADGSFMSADTAINGGEGIRIGVSGERRRNYALKVFPKAECLPIRGAIDSRLEQLSQGKFDAVLMAVAGLKRLYPSWDGGATLPVEAGEGLAAKMIGTDELPPPEGQGCIAVVFRKGDGRMTELRRNFVKAVRFTGAGVGDPGTITVRGAQDLEEADVVISDALSGFAGREDSPRWINAGKRCGAHSKPQEEITRLICDEARKGKRVVRLKGGDPGLFGRLSEETSALEELGIPYLVRPGVSALVAATAPNGLLLTKRGESAGFAVSTPRSAGNRKPQVFFMAAKMAEETLKNFPPDERYAMVWDALGPCERVETGLCGKPQLGTSDAPGLLVVGYAGDVFRRKRILLTCSETVMPQAARMFEDKGCRVVQWPMIALKVRKEALEAFGKNPEKYDAIVLTSPTAARFFFENCPVDFRRLPQFWTCGAGTDRELRRYGVSSDVMPESDFSAKGLAERLRREGNRISGKRVLRLASAKAGSVVSDVLREVGAEVDDAVLYGNEFVRREGTTVPEFDGVFFASSSAVESWLGQYGEETLSGKEIFVIGEPTRNALPREMRDAAVRFPLDGFQDKRQTNESWGGIHGR